MVYGITVILNVIIILLCVHLYAILIEGLGALIRGAGGAGGEVGNNAFSSAGRVVGNKGFCSRRWVGNKGFCSRSRGVGRLE